MLDIIVLSNACRDKRCSAEYYATTKWSVPSLLRREGMLTSLCKTDISTIATETLNVSVEIRNYVKGIFTPSLYDYMPLG